MRPPLASLTIVFSTALASCSLPTQRLRDPDAGSLDAATESVGLDDRADGLRMCTERADCNGTRPHCADSGVCVECTTSDDCPPAAPECIDNACARCASSATCATRPDAPACDLASGTCVECTPSEPSSCINAGKTKTPVCDPATRRCVECLATADCKDPDRSVCDRTNLVCAACTSNADCVLIGARNICLEGTCVECARDQIAACRAQDAGVQYVCDPASHACDRRRPARAKGNCDPCISDLECGEGWFCVDMPAGGGERVCLQAYDRQRAPCSRPYLGTADAISAEGVPVTVCTFRILNATCAAHRQLGNTPCRADFGDVGDDDKCGLAEVVDGYCVQESGTQEFHCTVACTNADVRDCPVDVTGCALQRHASGERYLCSLE